MLADKPKVSSQGMLGARLCIVQHCPAHLLQGIGQRQAPVGVGAASTCRPSDDRLAGRGIEEGRVAPVALQVIRPAAPPHEGCSEVEARMCVRPPLNRPLAVAQHAALEGGGGACTQCMVRKGGEGRLHAADSATHAAQTPANAAAQQARSGGR